jgi:PAS domain S-box-containing protein
MPGLNAGFANLFHKWINHIMASRISNGRLPFLVLLAGLAVTYFLQQAAVDVARQAQKDNFNFQANEVILRIEQRLAAYEQVLRGAKGLFAASKSVERDEFRDYVAALGLAEHYPGIQGVGFSLIVSPQEKSRHTQAVRKEGFPGYAVHPQGERDLYTSIIYLEPFAGRNLRAFGYDMYSEPVRRTAMGQARDSGKAAMSGKVRLVQETEKDVQAGFLMYLPVYHNGSAHGTQAERRANIVGWVYSPFRMNDLMQGILGKSANDVDLEIYDGKDAAHEALMYDSRSGQKHVGASLFAISKCMEVAGHNWHIRLHSLPVFEVGLDTGRTTVIRMTGILLSALLSLLVWLLASGRERALNLAEKMTSELRESEAASHAIIEAIPVPLALNDEQGNITYLNRAFVQTIGYTRDEIPALNDWWLRAYPDPQYRQWVADNWQKNMEKAKRSNEPFAPMELNIRCKDGAARTFLVGAASIREDFADTHLVILYNITERKQAEEKLRTLSTAIEQSPLSVVITDLDATIQYTNPHFTRVTGYSREEAIGQNPRILQSGLTPRETYDTMWETLTSGQVWRGELVNKRKNGEFYWEEVHIAPVMNLAGVLAHYVAVKLEITQRKRVEDALKESKSHIEMLLHSVAEGIYGVDMQGNCTFVNSAALHLLGYREETELLGKHMHDLIHHTRVDGSRYPSEECRLYRCMGSHESVHVSDEVFWRKDGSSFPVDYWSRSTTLDGKGGAVVTFFDITERKQHEAELLRSNAELEQFSYAVSHDMRQPLRMVSSYLQLLERSLANQLDGEKRDYFNFAIEGAKRIDRMLVDLLEYSRVGRKGEPPTWVESRALLDEALQFLQPTIAEARAKVDISGEWPRIHASHDEILRLLQNLIGNAVKYRIAGRVPEITVTSEIVKNEWRFCIADNGVGIIPNQIKRLFQIFQRLQSREAYEGTGIGLALCRKIAEHHKGRIWAESAGEGKGSRFYVVLPTIQEKGDTKKQYLQ